MSTNTSGVGASRNLPTIPCGLTTRTDLPLLPGLSYRTCRGCGLRFATSPTSKAKFCSDRCRHLRRESASHYKQGQYLAKSGRREQYDSSLELAHMRALDQQGITWTKAHSITLRYFDPKAQRERTYIPDFLLRLPGETILQEMKPQALVSDATVQAKAEAARSWCQRHGMTYVIVTHAGQVR